MSAAEISPPGGEPVSGYGYQTADPMETDGGTGEGEGVTDPCMPPSALRPFRRP